MRKYHRSVIRQAGQLGKVTPRIPVRVLAARVTRKEIMKLRYAFERAGLRVTCITEDNVAYSLTSDMALSCQYPRLFTIYP